METDPHLNTNGVHIDLRNLTGDYEGVYFCQAEYTDGQRSALVAAGCVFVAGT